MIQNPFTLAMNQEPRVFMGREYEISWSRRNQQNRSEFVDFVEESILMSKVNIVEDYFHHQNST